MSLRANVRNFLVPLTIAEVKQELDLSIERGDHERAKHVREFLQELEQEFNECGTPDLDEENPVDCDADAWAEIYSGMDDFEGFLDHDHSMDH